jgi:hypothetical protein
MATRVIKYVAYQFLNYALQGDSVREITTRNKRYHAKHAPAGVAGFYFFDVTVTKGVRSERQNISPTYYIDGVLLNAETIKSLPGNNAHVLTMMRRNGQDIIMRCRTGFFAELPDHYVIVSAA